MINFNNSTDLEDVFNHYMFWDHQTFVLNGISWSESDDSFILTGRAWNQIHKVKLDYHKYVKKEVLKKNKRKNDARFDDF